MIDWLDFNVELEHVPIPQGTFFVVEHDGEVLRQTSIKRRVEGSFDSTMGVSSQTLDYLPAHIKPDRMPEFFHLQFVSKMPKLGHCSHLCFSGNPTKFLQGHNVFGLDCIRTLAYQTALSVLPQLDFSKAQIDKVLTKIYQMDFDVSRIDITKMFQIGTNEDVNNYLYMLPQTVKARGNACDMVKNTFYVRKTSTLWTMKFYNKYEELQSKSKHHALHESIKELGIEDFAKGQLRVELTLRKKALSRLNLTHAKFLQPQLEELFKEYAEKIDMSNQTIQEKRLAKLSNAYQGTYALWKRGFRMQDVLSKPTYYRHRAKFLQLGIDIALPPVVVEQRKAVVEPITKHLSPREVVSVPAHLMRFMLEKVA